MKRSNLGDVLTATDATGTVLATNSPHPSSREGHPYRRGRNIITSSVRSRDARLGAEPSISAALSRAKTVLSAPAKLRFVTPHAMHDHRQPAAKRDDRSLETTSLGDIHRPGL